MTTDPLDDASLGAALAMLWQRHRQSNLDRISLLETTTADVLRAVVDEKATASAAGAAHQLAGSLGTFGFDAGSRAALEAEFLLRQPVIDGRLLAEAVTALRYAVQDVGDGSTVTPRSGPTGSSTERLQPDVLIDSADGELVARVTAEGAAFGVTIASTGDRTDLGGGGTAAGTPVLVDDGGPGRWTRTVLLNRVRELAETAFVVVLTDSDRFEERLELATAGAAAVIPRAQGARQLVLLLVEELATHRLAGTRVLTLGIEAEPLGMIRSSMDGLHCRIERHDDPLEFWQALEEHGADLVVVGIGASASIGLDLCRVIRAHPGWRQLPVVVTGAPTSDRRQDALLAGADDYLEARLSGDELGSRLRIQLERGLLVRARNDIDPLTGAENRPAVERSLERLLGLAHKRDCPCALVLIAVDRFEQIRTADGNAMADVVLRDLGRRLLEEFGEEDVVGRWTTDGFALGVYGATSQGAGESVTKVLAHFAADAFSTTSGKSARYAFKAGIASSPVDGSTLASLERVSETALRRAAAGKNAVVVAGERPGAAAGNPIDVVLVEDDDSVADVIEHALGLRDYEYLRFSDGAEAAKALGEGNVKARVVLLDVGLPSLDGFGVLEILNQQGVLEGTRVIMLTARSSEAEMLRALGLGAMEHIAKPFSIPVLLGRLDRQRAPVVA